MPTPRIRPWALREATQCPAPDQLPCALGRMRTSEHPPLPVGSYWGTSFPAGLFWLSASLSTWNAFSRALQQQISLPGVYTTKGKVKSPSGSCRCSRVPTISVRGNALCAPCASRGCLQDGRYPGVSGWKDSGEEMRSSNEALPIPTRSNVRISTSEPTTAYCMQMELLGYACQV